MTSPDLTNYIIQNLQLGYDLPSIKNSLIQSGYTASQVNAAIDYVSAQQQYQGTTTTNNWQKSSRKKPLPKPLLLIIGLFVITIAVAGFLIVFNSPSTTPPPSYQPPVATNPQLNNPPIQEQPVRDPQTIVEQPVNTPVDTSTPQIQEQRPVSAALSRLEIDETVAEIAATNPTKALEYCAQIVTRAGTFTCVTKVAFESKDYTHCENINDVAAKDTCYINFAINEIGDESVCQKIANQFKRGSCFELYETLEKIQDTQNQVQLSQEQINERIQAAELAQPPQEVFQNAATTSAFGSTSDGVAVSE